MSTSRTFINRVIGFSLASWANCLITLVATPITTALFAPEELGKIALFVSYANILIPFIYFGYDQAYMRFYNEPIGTSTKEAMYKLCCNIMLLLSFFVSIVVLVFWKYFSTSIIGYPSIIITASLVLYVVASLFSRMCNLKSRMDNNVKLFCIQSIVSTIIIKVSFVVVVVMKPAAEYAIPARSILLFAVFVLFFLFSYRQCRGVVDFSKETMTELSKFAVPLFPTIFLAMLSVSLSQIMLRRYVSFELMGIYANAITISSLISIVQFGLGSFWTPFVFEYYKDQKIIQKTQGIIVIVLLTMAFLLLMTQDLVYYILVDESYWGSKAIIAFLLISPVCDSLSETMGLGIELSKKTYLKLPVYIVSILVNVVGCITLIPRYGLLGAALAYAFTAISMLVVKSVVGEHYYRCCSNYFKLVVSMIILSVAGVINYFFHQYIILYAVIALLCIILMYRSEFFILLDNLKKYVKK